MIRYSKSVYAKSQGDFLTCGIFCEKKTEPEMEHVHDFVEIIYILDGKVVEHVNDSTFTATKGDLLFINLNSVHSFEPKHIVNYVNVVFNLEDVRKLIPESFKLGFDILNEFGSLLLKDERLFTFLSKERKSIEDLLELMLIEIKKAEKHKEEKLVMLLILLLSEINKKALSNKQQVDTWQEVIKVIDNNITDKITLDDLAKDFGYNPSYFSRIFKAKMGVTLSDYLSLKRLEKAKELLKNDLTIDEIVSASGFSGKATLYKTFTKFDGKTIKEYRQKVK